MQIQSLVFFSLVLDLLAFTIPLPLFPRLIQAFILQELKDGKSGGGVASGVQPKTLLVYLLNQVKSFRSTLLSYRSDSPTSILTAAHAQDVVLLGGLMGSVFSFCQFFVSPSLGKLSDRYGRKKVLLATMVGNILSAVVWTFSTNFEIYLLSRIIGGLSEGNVQLSVAIISDVVPEDRRARALALVGLAFSIAFTLGPSFGAWLSTKNFGKPAYTFLNPENQGKKMPEPARQVVQVAGLKFWTNVYAVPAVITLGLLVLETGIIAMWLPETRWLKEKRRADDAKENGGKKEEEKSVVKKESVEIRKKKLMVLEKQHAAFLFFFSGAEYTLTFLTFDIFNYSNAQNGMLLGFIGILSAGLQGGYVRRVTKKNPNASSTLIRQGISSCIAALLFLTILPRFAIDENERYELHGQFVHPIGTLLLYSAAVGLAITSATVVNGLTSLASVMTDDEQGTQSVKEKGDVVRNMEVVERGLWLGRFRSAGQLGRALGPIATTSVYFLLGPSACYICSAVGVGAVLFSWKKRETTKIKIE